MLKLMDTNAKQIAADALAMPADYRADLIDQLICSLDPASESAPADLHSAWVTEALNRRDDIRSGKVASINGPEALVQVKNNLAK